MDATTARLFDLEQQKPGRALLPAVVRHLSGIAEAVDRAGDEDEWRRLTLMHGQTAALAGWLMFEQGNVRGVHRHWDTALAIASYIKSDPLLACVQTYLSYAVAEQGDPTTAWQLACTALSHSGNDNRVRAWMAARAAQEAAGLGEQAAAFANLDVAIELANEIKPITPSDATPPWARFVDRAHVYGMVANAFSRMKIRSDALIAAIWASDTLSDGRTKARAQTLAEIAYAFAAVRQLDQAMPYAAEAAELADQLGATLATRRLRAIVRLLPKSSNSERGS